MIKGMLGGNMGPMMAEEHVTAHANGTLKPFSRIASISIRPNPPMSANAEPEMPEKTKLPKIFTCAKPPGNRPTAVSANLYM